MPKNGPLAWRKGNLGSLSGETTRYRLNEASLTFFPTSGFDSFERERAGHVKGAAQAYPLKTAISNNDISELLALEAEREEGIRQRAFKRAARNAFLWPEHARDLVAEGRSLLELKGKAVEIESRNTSVTFRLPSSNPVSPRRANTNKTGGRMKKQNRLLRQGSRLSILITGLIFALLQTARLQAQTYQVVVYDPPAGFDETRGEGVGGQQRVGAARLAGAALPENTHAFLWTGNSPTPIDLHPANWTYSWAHATDGIHQVGYVEGQNPPYSNRRAALWSGTPESLVLLSPLSDWGFSEAVAIAGNQQVGFVDSSFCGNGTGSATDGGGGCTYRIHAMVWSGTPESRVDLHPTALAGANAPGDQRSRALDTDGASQVGYVDLILPLGGGSYTSETHALLWHGTGTSAIDLHPQGWDASYAYGVKNNTQVGYGIETAGFSDITAFVWHGSAQSRVALGEGTVLDTNGATHVGAIGVNNSSHAFRWDGDSGSGFDLHNLLPAGYINSGASGINDAGDIIGWAQKPSGYLVGVLWSNTTPNVAPTVSIMSPAPNSVYYVNNSLILTASAHDSDGSVRQVEYFANGASIGVVTASASTRNFGMKWRATRVGTVRFQAKATDDRDGSTMSVPVTIKVKSAQN